MAETDTDPEWYRGYQDSPCREKLAALGILTRKSLTTIDSYSELLSRYYRDELKGELTKDQLLNMVDKIREAVGEIQQLQHLMRTDFRKSE
jgi:hypothetical protein